MISNSRPLTQNGIKTKNTMTHIIMAGMLSFSSIHFIYLGSIVSTSTAFPMLWCRPSSKWFVSYAPYYKNINNMAHVTPNP